MHTISHTRLPTVYVYLETRKAILLSGIDWAMKLFVVGPNAIVTGPGNTNTNVQTVTMEELLVVKRIIAQITTTSILSPPVNCSSLVSLLFIAGLACFCPQQTQILYIIQLFHQDAAFVDTSSPDALPMRRCADAL